MGRAVERSSSCNMYRSTHEDWKRGDFDGRPQSSLDRDDSFRAPLERRRVTEATMCLGRAIEGFSIDTLTSKPFMRCSGIGG